MFRPPPERSFIRRLWFLFGLQLMVCAALSYYLLQLQFFEHERYLAWSENNRIQHIPIAPPRGKIYDRRGVVIAENRPAWRLEIHPSASDDISGLLAKLEAIIPLDEKNIAAFSNHLSRYGKYKPFVLKDLLQIQEVAKLAAASHKLPGVNIVGVLERYYPQADIVAHVVGYTGNIDKNDTAKVDKKVYLATKRIGKTNIEKWYEKLLHGSPGVRQVEINAHGRIIRRLGGEQPSPGKDLKLTIDLDLQRVAHDAIGNYEGAAVALDPSNGDILALVSKPSYNPNWFFHGMDKKSYQLLSSDKRSPLFNRAVSGNYPPASVIKPIIALLGLELNKIKTDELIYAQGVYTVSWSDRVFYDWKPEGHGLINLNGAISRSCDYYFYELANRLGIKNISSGLGKFGLGAKTGIDLPGESAGLLPSEEWKIKTNRGAWSRGETLMLGIGQSFLSVTPLQLAQATMTIANRGVVYKPRLLKSVRSNKGQWEPRDVEHPRTIFLKPEHWSAVINAMVDTVHDRRGTAHSLRRSGNDLVAGKTGTAQTYRIDHNAKIPEEDLPKHKRDHSLFVAFAPAYNPRIVVAVVIEHAGVGSRYAAPAAQKIIDAWLYKKRNTSEPI